MLNKLKALFKKKDGRYVIRYEESFEDVYKIFQEYTMTSKARMNALYESIVYLHQNNIPGDFVECGIWKGGSSMLMLEMINHLKMEKDLYMYDTFEGMTTPQSIDVDMAGNQAIDMLNKKEIYPNVHAFCSLSDVKANFKLFFEDFSNCKFVKGDVLKTIPNIAPSKISLLRLDTDWYQSTYHELKHFYPKVVDGGIVIIDDYGHWKGSKQATDQYFKEIKKYPLLNRVDYSGRLIVKK